MPAAHAESLVLSLLAIARRHGTPTYAYDVDRLEAQVTKLKATLSEAVDVYYSFKANPSLGLCQLMAGWGLGADVVSAGELFTALEAGFAPDRILVGGPYKSIEVLDQLRVVPQAMLSIDSLSELRTLASRGQPHRVILRLRPDFASSAAVATGPDTRFGIPMEDLPQCRAHLSSGGIVPVGFHVYSGSQVLDASAIVRQLRGATRLALRATDLLGIAPEILNLGGGFGVPYCADDEALDLGPIADELRTLVDQTSPARILLELGRYLVAQSGWYLTTVVAHQTYRGRHAVVVDGGVHHRADICGLGLRTKVLPPLALGDNGSSLAPTEVLGCLCLPDDVLAESSLLPPLSLGDVLAFPNAGAYGLSAAPTLFLSHPAPAEVAFRGTNMEVLRPRMLARELLSFQTRLQQFR